MLWVLNTGRRHTIQGGSIIQSSELCPLKGLLTDKKYKKVDVSDGGSNVQWKLIVIVWLLH